MKPQHHHQHIYILNKTPTLHASVSPRKEPYKTYHVHKNAVVRRLSLHKRTGTGVGVGVEFGAPYDSKMRGKEEKRKAPAYIISNNIKHINIKKMYIMLLILLLLLHYLFMII